MGSNAGFYGERCEFELIASKKTNSDNFKKNFICLFYTWKACKNFTCKNGGKCNRVYNANNVLEPKCYCQDGFYGKNCEYENSK